MRFFTHYIRYYLLYVCVLGRPCGACDKASLSDNQFIIKRSEICLVYASICKYTVVLSLNI